MSEVEMTEAEAEEYEEFMAEQKEEDVEDQILLGQELQDNYGHPVPDEKHNQHTFLNKAAFDTQDTVRTTFLSEQELGRPLFSVRFYLDMHDISKYYLDSILSELEQKPAETNGIANYFWEKIQNITSSGQSNKGFAMNLSVTQKRDMMRKKMRVSPESNLKGGKP